MQGVCVYKGGSVLISICRYVNVCKFFTSVVLHLAVFSVYHSSLPVGILNPTHSSSTLFSTTSTSTLISSYYSSSLPGAIGIQQIHDLVHKVNDLIQLHPFMLF